MAIKDLIPWNRGRDVAVRRSDETSPFLTLHREMNRLFDDVFRGFDLAPMGSGDLGAQRRLGRTAFKNPIAALWRPLKTVSSLLNRSADGRPNWAHRGA